MLDWIGLDWVGDIGYSVVLSCFLGFGNVGVYLGVRGFCNLQSNQRSSSCRSEVCRDGYPERFGGQKSCPHFGRGTLLDLFRFMCDVECFLCDPGL